MGRTSGFPLWASGSQKHSGKRTESPSTISLRVTRQAVPSPSQMRTLTSLFLPQYRSILENYLTDSIKLSSEDQPRSRCC